MRVEGKQTVQIIGAPCKLDVISSTVKHEQKPDNSGLYRKISDKPKCSSRKDLSLQSIGTIISTEVLNTSSETENLNAEKYDTSTSESNVIQQFERVSWKYKNPYSVSISNHINYEKSIHTLENILKDEPQEGKIKQSILSNCREYLGTYQEFCDTPRTEYTFAALIVVMTQAMARSLLALIYVIINVAPVIQMFFFILRFVLDKIIDMYRTKNFRQVMVKLIIFIIQLLSVYVFLIFILSHIILPIVQMTISIATKFATRN